MATNGIALIFPTPGERDHGMCERLMRRAGLSSEAFDIYTIHDGGLEKIWTDPTVKVVIGCGESVLRYVIGETDIRRWQNRPIEHISGKIFLPSFLPSKLVHHKEHSEPGVKKKRGILNPPRFQICYIYGLHKALRIVKYGFTRQEGTYVLDPSPGEFKRFVHELISSGREFTFDIETAYKQKAMKEDELDEGDLGLDSNKLITRISFSYQPHWGLTVPYSGPYLADIKELLASPNDKIVWNGCPTPDQRLLTADLRWLRAGDITVGTELLGFDEESTGRGKRRAYRAAVVEAVQRATAPVKRVHFTDGSNVTVTTDHRWLVPNTSGNGANYKWRTTDELEIGMSCAQMMQPWEQDNSRTAGYLAGFFDGEGCLHYPKGRSLRAVISATQKQGVVSDEVLRSLADLNVESAVHPHTDDKNKGLLRFVLKGRTANIVRFLGVVRPARLLAKFKPEALGTLQSEAPVITAIEECGEQEVVKIATSTHTYVLEGFAAHNCNFDVPILEENGVKVTGDVFDYMDAWHMYMSDLDKDLEFTSGMTTDALPWKHLNLNQPALYNAMDSDVQMRCAVEIRKLLESARQWNLFKRHGVYLSPILKEAGKRGNCIDIAAQNQLGEELEQEYEKLTGKAQGEVPFKLYPRDKIIKTKLPEGGALATDGVEAARLFDQVERDGTIKQCDRCEAIITSKTAHQKGKKNPCKGASVLVLPAIVPGYQEILPFNPNSSDQMKEYMRRHGHPLGKSKDGEDKETADAKHLKKLVKIYPKHPIYQTALELHKVTKALGTYVEGLRPDKHGWIYTTYVNCVSGDHQVLTPNGWVDLRALLAGTSVAQWEQGTNCVSFVVPSNIHVGVHADKVVEIQGPRIDLTMTPNHRVPVLESRGQAREQVWNTYTADTLPAYGRIPTSGLLSGTVSDTQWARFAIAVQADGNIRPSGQIRFGLTRERKQIRLRALLTECGIKYTEAPRANGQIVFALDRADTAPVFQYLDAAKSFQWPSFLALTLEAKREVIAESLLWDGHIRASSPSYKCYQNTHRRNVELLQTLAHVTGGGASWKSFQPAMPGANMQHLAQFNAKRYTHLHQLKFHRVRQVETPEMMYCVEVPTGFFLVKHKDKIVVTGNSPSTWRLGSRAVNVQNIGKRESNPWAKRARSTIIASPGNVLVQADSSSIEAVLVGYFMGDQDYIKLAKQSIHAYVVCKVLGLEFTPANIKLVKSEHIALYDQMKITNHLSNYGGTPHMMCELFPELFPTVGKARELQGKLFEVLPQLPRWHHELRHTAQKEGYLETPWGYRHYFWDVFSLNANGTKRYGKDSKRCIAFKPQNSAGAIARDNILIMGTTLEQRATDPECYPLADGNLWGSYWRQYMPANLTVHDGYCLDVPLHYRDAVAKYLAKLLTRPIYELGGLRIGCEVEWGTDWGHMEKLFAITTLEDEVELPFDLAA